MKLNFGHICENAFITEYNTPTIIGIFSKIRSTKLPAMRRNIGVVLEFIPEDKNKHTARLELRDPKGGLMKGKKDVELGPADSPDQALGLVSNFSNLKFEYEGDYTFNVFVDSKKISELKFSLEVEKQSINK